MKIGAIETTAEERRIIICAIGGFQLDAEERKTIRPFYLRLLNAEHPGLVRPEVMAALQPLTAGFYKAVCATCNDTHTMQLGDATVGCTRCPTPCEKCRSHPSGHGPGAYCTFTPCPCSCHQQGDAR